MKHPIIVVGGSAGSIGVLSDILAQLPRTIGAAVFVVVHLQRHVPSKLTAVLSRVSVLPVCEATDQQKIQPGQVYVAPSDYHLFLERNNMLLVRGPLENRMRPAIDVLFRSAAVAHRDRVIGVILSGLLDDGVAGLQAIKRCGGRTMVQTPDDAQFSSMPESAIAAMDVDYIVPVAAMADRLQNCVAEPPETETSVPKDIALEAQMVKRVMFNADEMAQMGEPSYQSCPDCRGPLWQMKDSDTLRYRCHVGHSFTAQALVNAQDETAEEALWVALRTLEERARVLERISRDTVQSGAHNLAQRYQERAEQALKHATSIRRLIYASGSEEDTAAENIIET